MKKLILILFVFFGIQEMSSAQTQPCPCCTDAHRAFDFWLGDWEAFQPNGNLAGTNKIVLLQDSCIIQENWTSAGTTGYTGTSYNWYDVTTNTWHQSWIDNQGGSLLLSGKRVGDQMILSSANVPDGSGGKTMNKITWTDLKNGHVRQLWEISNDEGKSWAVAFDGIYKPKKN